MVRLVDISRLIENMHLRTPTGIDRVEMAYVQHMLARAAGEREAVRFVVTWPHLTGTLDEAYVRPLIEAMAARWSTDGRDLGRDAAFAALRDVLGQPLTLAGRRQAQRIGSPDGKADAARLLRTAEICLRSAAGGGSLRRLAASGQGAAWYFHTSQFRLHRPQRFAWLSQPAVRSLFFLHDIIPITHEEYCRPREAPRHAQRVATMARHADVIVANSAFTRAALTAHLDDLDVPAPPCEVVPLGLADIFLAPPPTPPVEAAVPYFVVIGTIEPRKNLAFLLQAWNRWTGGGQARQARLVVVGRRGWENENVIDLLERSPGLAPTVIEVASLSDAGMIALLRGAQALLAPSLVEGFGLPVAEALALGVPVIASAIDAHREVGGDFAEYINPLDGPGWVAALEAYARPDSERRRQRAAALHRYRPLAWSDHMARVEDLVAEIAE